MVVPAVYRDFNAGGDFEPGVTGSNLPITGMVQAALSAQGKPVYSGTGGYVTSAASFANWYKDVASVNTTHVGQLKLWNNGSGAFVNRWGANGEQWMSTTQGWCGNVGKEDPAQANAPCTFEFGATDCQTKAATMLAGSCVKNAAGTEWTATFVDKRYDGNPVFFPVDSVTGHLTPIANYSLANVPSAYGGWYAEPGALKHNFHFTSEVRYWFQYFANQTYTLDFLGDDDVWVFINKKLTVDLGGIHTPINGRVIIGATGNGASTVTPSEGTGAAVTGTVPLGLKDGEVYEIVVFQAERQTSGSSYKLTLSGFNASASLCGPICGDGELAPGEQCDDGTNTGGYGKCQPNCIRGDYCGDGKVNGPETCDNGTNVSAYGSTGCAPGCVTPPRCGDGKVQPAFGETCDDGVNDGAYGGCTATCQFAPRCGDGTVNGSAGTEACDDGANDGSYNNCAPGCKLGPRCGDGVLSESFGEQCEDGNTTNGDGCSSNCRFEGVCGDTIVDGTTGEECDDGVNDGGYGECAPSCKFGPRCGDGVTQPEEVCDAGPNPTGGYGECAKGCVLGPYCGDGKVQSGFEECDDGNKKAQDGCSPACKIETPQIL
jgi:fibro-slime domain-containing protein